MKRANATRPSTALAIIPPRTDNDAAGALDELGVLWAVEAEVAVGKTTDRGFKVAKITAKPEVKVVVGKKEIAECLVRVNVEAVINGPG